jgi:hypothetical protein
MMLTLQQDSPQAEPSNEGVQQLQAAVGRQVMSQLGSPDRLHRVQVRRLWANYCRVNVFVGVDAASARVAHSYFLLADGDGNILESTPPIARQY